MSGGTLYTSAKRPGGQIFGGTLCTTTPALGNGYRFGFAHDLIVGSSHFCKISHIRFFCLAMYLNISFQSQSFLLKPTENAEGTGSSPGFTGVIR